MAGNQTAAITGAGMPGLAAARLLCARGAAVRLSAAKALFRDGSL